MPKPWMVRCAKAVGALAVAVALSGCIVVPGYGFYHRPHPFYYY